MVKIVSTLTSSEILNGRTFYRAHFKYQPEFRNGFMRWCRFVKSRNLAEQQACFCTSVLILSQTACVNFRRISLFTIKKYSPRKRKLDYRQNNLLYGIYVNVDHDTSGGISRSRGKWPNYWPTIHLRCHVIEEAHRLEIKKIFYQQRSAHEVYLHLVCRLYTNGNNIVGWN
jgi:hypothetical protein